MAGKILRAQKRYRSRARSHLGTLVAEFRSRGRRDLIRFAQVEIHRRGWQAGRVASAGHLLNGGGRSSCRSAAPGASPGSGIGDGALGGEMKIIGWAVISKVRSMVHSRMR